MVNAAEIAATLGDGRGWQWRYCCPPRRQPIAEAARRAGCVMCWSGCDRAVICRAASTDGISSRSVPETADAGPISPSNGAGAGSRNRKRSIAAVREMAPKPSSPRRDRDSAASSVGAFYFWCPHRLKVGKVPGFRSSGFSRPICDIRARRFDRTVHVAYSGIGAGPHHFHKSRSLANAKEKKLRRCRQEFFGRRRAADSRSGGRELAGVRAQDSPHDCGGPTSHRPTRPRGSHPRECGHALNGCPIGTY
jgi:hypothetical protein